MSCHFIIVAHSSLEGNQPLKAAVLQVARAADIYTELKPFTCNASKVCDSVNWKGSGPSFLFSICMYVLFPSTSKVVSSVAECLPSMTSALLTVFPWQLHQWWEWTRGPKCQLPQKPTALELLKWNNILFRIENKWPHEIHMWTFPIAKR